MSTTNEQQPGEFTAGAQVRLSAELAAIFATDTSRAEAGEVDAASDGGQEPADVR